MDKNRGWDRGKEDAGSSERGADVFHLLGKVANKFLSCEGARRGEEGRECHVTTLIRN